jgi:CubicO group peptidase (beta-lactamase class C family)
MRPAPARCVIAFASLLAAAGAGPASEKALPRDTGRFDFRPVTAKLQALADDKVADGFALVLVKDGAVIYERAFGRFTTATAVPIASATKLPTTMAVLTLVDRKKLALDDRVSKYLPDWPADKADMTVRHCLSCTSGLPFRQAFMFDPRLTLADSAREIGRLPLRAGPGEEFNYSGNGFQVAGRVAEVAGGKPWHDLFREALADPLGFTAFAYGGGKNPPLGGGATSNLEDYAKLLCVHLNKGTLNGARVLSPELVAEMQRDHVGDKKLGFSPAAAKGWHYGLSWWIVPPEKGQPATEFCDPGAFGATPWIDTRRGYGGFLLIRKDLLTGMRVWNAVRPLIREALDRPAAPVKAAQDGGK